MTVDATQLALQIPSAAELAFREYNAKHPHVLRLLTEAALEWKAAGYDKCSIDLIHSVVRWRTAVETHDDTYRLSNNFRPRYARLIMENNPHLNGFFDVRPLRDEKETAE